MLGKENSKGKLSHLHCLLLITFEDNLIFSRNKERKIIGIAEFYKKSCVLDMRKRVK